MGPMYKNTKHNVGIMAIQHSAQRSNSLWKKAGNMLNPADAVQTPKCTLIHPVGFMNAIGKPTKAAIKNLGAKPTNQNMVVLHDDLEQKLGKFRVVAKTSFRGHNGLRSIQAETGMKEFTRIGIGIGRPESREPAVVARYVLEAFTEEEMQTLSQVFDQIHEKHIKTGDFTPVVNQVQGQKKRGNKNKAAH